jgi:hypothetical protein
MYMFFIKTGASILTGVRTTVTKVDHTGATSETRITGARKIVYEISTGASISAWIGITFVDLLTGSYSQECLYIPGCTHTRML